MTRGPLRLLRDFAALSGGEMVAKIAGFAAFAYLSRVLGPPAYGAVELAVAIVTFASLVVDFGFGPIAAAELTRDRGQARALAARVPAVRLALAVAALGIVAAAAFLLELSEETRTLLLVFGLSLLLLPWTQNWLFQGLDLMAWVAPAQPLRMIAFLLGVVVFVSGPEPLWRVGALEIGAVAVMVVYYLAAQAKHRIPWRLTFDSRFSRQLVRKALPISLSQLLWAFNQYLPTVLVAALVAGSEVAWFGSSLRIVISLNTFVWLYFFNLYPTLVESSALPVERFESLTARSFRITAWAGLLCGLVGTLWAEPLCRLAYGPEFSQAGPTFAVLVWVLPVSLLSGHARFSLIAYGRQNLELVSAAAGSIVTLVAALVLVPPLGAVGAAVSMVASAIVVWVLAHRFTMRRVGRIPAFRPLLRPLIAALVAGAIAWVLSTGGQWLAGAGAALVFVGLAPLIDRSLIGDVAALGQRSENSRPESAETDNDRSG